MKYLPLAVLGVVSLISTGYTADPKPAPRAQPKAVVPANPAIDMEGYLKVAQEAAKHRQTRRVTEAQFIEMSAAEGTIILDARSKQLFDVLHIKGAINLSFPDIAVETLKKTLPDKNARILIYCNNNFKNSPAAFPSKAPVASLNLSTYISLYSYGYQNVYELAPLIDPKTSKLPFESGLKGSDGRKPGQSASTVMPQ